MSDHDWNAGDPPLGESGQGDFTVVVHALHMLAAPEDECGRRCTHGGVCTLVKGHQEPHDADGHCQWGGTT